MKLKYGELTVIGLAGFRHVRNDVFLCKCDCGIYTYAQMAQLTRGKKKTCGCHFEQRRNGKGIAHTPTYLSWASMKRRCYDKNFKQYKDYGGRGVTVCDRWLESIENFIEDMGERPEGCTLDRIDTDGNYCKENCKWSTKSEQVRNRRANFNITIDGETKCLEDWCIQYGINRSTVYSRLVRNWDIKKALTTPINKNISQAHYNRKK